MGTMQYEGCYARWDARGIILGNGLVERSFCLSRERERPGPVRNPVTGYLWYPGEDTPAEAYDRPGYAGITYEARVDDRHGLSAPHLSVTATLQGDGFVQRRCYMVYPDSPFLSVRVEVRGLLQPAAAGGRHRDSDGVEVSAGPAGMALRPDAIDLLPLPHAHLRAEAIALYDKTDSHDTLASVNQRLLYGRECWEADGNLLRIEDYVAGEGLLIVKEAPTHLSALHRATCDFVVDRARHVQVLGTGMAYGQAYEDFVYQYGVTIGVGSCAGLLEAYKRHYRLVYRGDPRRHGLMMSNTWGDRNQDSAVCEGFILREIDVAAQLGLDIVQIDDGWQQGITANSKLAGGGVWEGYYAFDDDFWQVNAAKFPRGLAPVAGHARARGIALGLWFSPDSSNDFANWRRDAQTLLSLYRAYGIAYFKLDGVKIRSKLAERRYLDLLEQVWTGSGGKIGVNQDITAEDRLGYLYHKEHGTLFVENRYTDWGNYYPHNTLKNLWTVSRYFPSIKFQFELLNPTRNRAVYGDDPFAPGRYGMDYLFATVMVANPLFWMELTALPTAERAALGGILAVYRQHRAAMWGGMVMPMGQCPDGQSFTGFQVVTGASDGYLLIFREAAPEDCRVLPLPAPIDGDAWTPLYASAPGCALRLEGGSVCVTMPQQRSFLFARYGESRG